MDLKYQKAFGSRLREARKKEKLTQEQLAQFLGVTKQSVNHWELGRWLPEAEQLQRIAARLRISLDWLMTGVEHSANSSARPLATGQIIPRLTMPELLDYAKGKLQLRSVRRRHITMLADDVASLIAFDLATPALETGDRGGIMEGSILTVQFGKPPRPGEVVVAALLAREEIHCGRWRPDPAGKPNDFTLTFDHPHFGERHITAKDKPKLIGTMVEVVTLRSR